MSKVFVCGELWERDLFWYPVKSEYVYDYCSRRYVALVATVVFDIWSNVPSFNAVRVPSAALVESFVDNNIGARWS